MHFSANAQNTALPSSYVTIGGGINLPFREYAATLFTIPFLSPYQINDYRSFSNSENTEDVTDGLA